MYFVFELTKLIILYNTFIPKYDTCTSVIWYQTVSEALYKIKLSGRITKAICPSDLSGGALIVTHQQRKILNKIITYQPLIYDTLQMVQISAVSENATLRNNQNDGVQAYRFK